MNVLVTGGFGYIGSHTTYSLLERGHEVVVLDNGSNGNMEAIRRVESLAGRSVRTCVGDVSDVSLVSSLLEESDVQAVIHFAGLKSVADSLRDPLGYYRNNVAGTLALLEAMRKQRVYNLVFSSSATVYSADAMMPVQETASLGPINPYGRSKLMAEWLIGDHAQAEHRFRAHLLRYFNPVGAHPSGRIGEDPRGEPANLLPYVTQVAIGRRAKLRVFGSDYATRDGTCIRDYIHVMDLAEAHVASLEAMPGMNSGVEAINIGTGQGTTVLELLEMFHGATQAQVPYEMVGRREGDMDAVWADCSRAKDLLGWKATRSLDEACADAWEWQTRNPEGYWT